MVQVRLIIFGKNFLYVYYVYLLQKKNQKNVMMVLHLNTKSYKFAQCINDS